MWHGSVSEWMTYACTLRFLVLSSLTLGSQSQQHEHKKQRQHLCMYANKPLASLTSESICITPQVIISKYLHVTSKYVYHCILRGLAMEKISAIKILVSNSRSAKKPLRVWQIGIGHRLASAPLSYHGNSDMAIELHASVDRCSFSLICLNHACSSQRGGAEVNSSLTILLWNLRRVGKILYNEQHESSVFWIISIDAD